MYTRGLSSVDLFGHCTGILNPFNLVSPDCWALAFPETTSSLATLTGNSSVTPEQMQNPTAAYPPPPVTTPNLSPPAAILTTPPADAVQANAVIDAIAQQNQEALDAQNRAFFQNVASAGTGTGGGINWLLWGGLAAVGIVLFALARK